MQTTIYELQSSGNGHIYTFISKGYKSIVKVVRYDRMHNFYYSKSGAIFNPYNLGFGDKKNELFEFDDFVRSNNGDMLIVFNTVLHTIPMFLEKVGPAAIHIQGSDKIRHLAYHRFINTNYSYLEVKFDFYGSENDVIKDYVIGTIYTYIVIIPKML